MPCNIKEGFVISVIINKPQTDSKHSIQNEKKNPKPFSLKQSANKDKKWLMRSTKPTVSKPIRTLRGCDLFSGCGGITLGLYEACRSNKMKLEMIIKK